MRHLHNKLLILLLTIPSLTWALPSDRNEPIQIEADHAQLDDEQGITQYKGDAILTQGTLKIRGDIITFYYDDDKELIKTVAQGKLAKYQQIQKPGEKPVRAQAYTMEYHAQGQKIYLMGKGHVWQNGNEFSGNRIEYDIAKNIVNASGGTKSSDTSTKPKKGERIHIIIQPPGGKKKSKSSVKKEPKAAVTIKPEEVIEPEAINSEAVANKTVEAEVVYPTATTTTNLHIRTGPGTTYNKLGIFNIGDELIILTEQKEWLQVRGVINDQAVIGWVFRRYTRTN